MINRMIFRHWSDNYKNNGADYFFSVRRQSEINGFLNRNLSLLYRIRKIYHVVGDDYAELAYVVTVRKQMGVSFEERINVFFECLSSVKNTDELFIHENKCFKIKGQNYTISYCFEGYKKSADKIGYMENDLPKFETIRRMSCEAAFKMLKGFPIDKINRAYAGMCLQEMCVKYPCPAERFSACVYLVNCEIKMQGLHNFIES